MGRKHYIGWDVGAWSCKKSSKSCDALVVIDQTGKLIGKPFRNALKEALNEPEDTLDFISKLLKYCEVEPIISEEDEFILAIDTPLGYPEAFIHLITGYTTCEIADHSKNSYLFRQTEQSIFNNDLKTELGKKVRPLSAINDMIGAQSTKGIHVISKFAPQIEETGVWTDGKYLKIIEAYPTLNRKILKSHIDKLGNLHPDVLDAYNCACVAYLFDRERSALAEPYAFIPKKEGWIWYITNSSSKLPLPL